MNQASLHRVHTSKPQAHKASDLNALYELRFATNLTLIKDLFFSLYPEENNRISFGKLLKTLPSDITYIVQNRSMTGQRSVE